MNQFLEVKQTAKCVSENEPVAHEVDVRAMVRLLGKTIALPGGHEAKKRFLMNGICELIGADTWTPTVDVQSCPKDERTKAWDEAKSSPVVLRACPPDGKALEAIAFYRQSNGRPFTDREIQIARLMLEEIPWLHRAGWTEDQDSTVPKLSPRKRMVLNLLLDGLGRKQIAHQLDISENTVSGYCREVYRTFAVTSQAQLMHRHLAATDQS